MKYNRAEIMKSAWRRYSNEKSRCSAGYITTAPTFGECLKTAWTVAKREVAQAEAAAARRQAAAEKAARKFVGMVTIGWGKSTIEVNPYNGDVTGNTYAWRKEIKACGGQWCPDDRIWSFTPDQAQEFCRKYA